jgi:hypothetical protein
MSRRHQRFRADTPHAGIADIAKMPAATTSAPDFGNNGKFGTEVAIESDAAYVAGARRGAERALSPVDEWRAKRCAAGGLDARRDDVGRWAVALSVNAVHLRFDSVHFSWSRMGNPLPFKALSCAFSKVRNLKLPVLGLARIIHEQGGRAA